MKRANCKENVPNAGRNEVVVAVQLIDKDIQQRVKTLIPDSELYELQEKVALCLQVERNNWLVKIQSVFRQLNNEHKKAQKVKNALLDILLCQYSPEKYQHIFKEDIEINDIVNHLKELILDLKSVNLKLIQDLNSLKRSRDHSYALSKKGGETESCVLKQTECENQLIQDQDLVEYGENNRTACSKLKDWCQDKSLASYDDSNETQHIFEKQLNENKVNQKTELKRHEEEPVTINLGHKCLLPNQELVNSKIKEHNIIPNVKTNVIKTYMNHHSVKMKNQFLLKPLSKACIIGDKIRVSNHKKKILQCHQVNGYDIKTDHKNQIFQERFFSKLVAKGPIKYTFPGVCNKNDI